MKIKLTTFLLLLFFFQQIPIEIKAESYPPARDIFLIPFYKGGLGDTPWINGNYNKMGAFLGFSKDEALWLFQGDLLFIESNQWGGSLGTGLRICRDHCLGLNIFYDFMKTNIQTWHQLGVGVEALFIYDLNFRANLYIPLSSRNRSSYYSYNYPETIYRYSEHAIENQAFGLNGEVSRLLKISRNLTGCWALSPYFLSFSNQNAFGMSLKGSLCYRKILSIEVVATRDSIYKNLVQGSLTLSLPHHFNRKKCPTAIPKPIERWDSIVIKDNSLWEWNW